MLRRLTATTPRPIAGLMPASIGRSAVGTTAKRPVQLAVRPRARLQSTTAENTPVATAPPAAAPKSGAINPLTGQPSNAKYDKSDWYYIGVAFFSIFGVAAPFVLLSYIQDEREVREWMRVHCPSVLDALKRSNILEIPSDVHPSAVDLILPRAVKITVGGGEQKVVPASTPLLEVLNLAAQPDGNDLIAAVLTANAAGLHTIAVSSDENGSGEDPSWLYGAGSIRPAPLHALAQLARDPSRVALPYAALGALTKAVDLDREVAKTASVSDGSLSSNVFEAAGTSLAVADALKRKEAVAAAREGYTKRPVFDLLPSSMPSLKPGGGWWASLFSKGKANSSGNILDDDRDRLEAERARKGVAVASGSSSLSPGLPRYRLAMGGLADSACRARIARIQRRLDSDYLQHTAIPRLEDALRNKRAEVATAAMATSSNGEGAAVPRPLARRPSTSPSTGAMVAPLDVKRLKASGQQQEQLAAGGFGADDAATAATGSATAQEGAGKP